MVSSDMKENNLVCKTILYCNLVDKKSHIYIIEFKYEWLSLTLTKIELNVRYIKEVSHISNALRFWVEMMSKSLVVLETFD